MNNLASNPGLLALYGSQLQKTIDVFADVYKQDGYVRFDRTIEDASGRVVAPNLLTQFRTLAAKLDARMTYEPSPRVVQFVMKMIPSLRTPEINFTPYKAKPAVFGPDPLTGELVQLKRPLKAQTVISFGLKGSSLTGPALLDNQTAQAQWDAIEAQFLASANGTTATIAGSQTIPATQPDVTPAPVVAPVVVAPVVAAGPLTEADAVI